MKNLHNPKWLLIINTIPLIILFFLYGAEYNIIKSLLSEETISLWISLGSALASLGILNLGYAVYCIVLKKEVSAWYGVLSLVCYISFLYAYGYHAEDLIPRDVPRWMVPDMLLIYAGTFLMPTLAYSLFLLVNVFTPSATDHKAWKSFLAALAVPLGWYGFVELVLPFWQGISSGFADHTIIILVIAGTLVFLFFLIRAVYILARKKSGVFMEYQLAWKIPVALILPLFGLCLNNGDFRDAFNFHETNVFGDFSNNWFYILAFVNGLLICLPDGSNRVYRLLLLAARSITFAFTLYFFIVFLPFLPLSVVAIVAFGAGFLMLTPLVLFVIHVRALTDDFNFLKTRFSGRLLNLLTVGGFLVIPICITAAYLHDREVLDETLDYIYAPDFDKEYTLDKKSLAKTLAVISYHKDRGRGGFGGKHLPYLSSWFNWLVLDNLTLSDAKINTIERIVDGTPVHEQWNDDIRNKDVSISKISPHSRFDKSQNAWISWVDLEISNNQTDGWFAEYATTLDLPAGCWISDYYLYVGDKKEPGILAEKKSAMWVFTQIRNTNRDPGILFYLTGNKVTFRVFPFTKGEVRKTGIEFIHREPVTLTIDGNSIMLGDTAQHTASSVTESPDKNVVYIPAAVKSGLPEIQRLPYYHFMVDASNGKGSMKAEFIKRMELLLEKKPFTDSVPKVSFVNTYTTTLPSEANWKEEYNKQTFEGGFYLDRAIKKTLFTSATQLQNSYPVIVVVSDNMENAILENDYSDFKAAYPESEFFYRLDDKGHLHPHSLSAHPKKELPDSLTGNFTAKVLAFPDLQNTQAFLQDDNKASIIIKMPVFEEAGNEMDKKQWMSGLMMQGKWQSHVLHPYLAEKEWLRMVQYSFISGIMSPVTSYLVVENEAQRAILKRKQEQVLSGNKLLDLDEESQRMSEPGFIIMAVLLLAGLWIIKRRKLALRV